jgi:ribosomal peptide maturation radical SAM protein 1
VAPASGDWADRHSAPEMGVVARGAKTNGVDVVFVVMPFADIQSPAIGVSLLQAQLDRRGLSSRILYLNVTFAEMIGADLHGRLSAGLSSNALAGEWFFADCVFGADIPPDYDYVSKVLSRSAPPDTVADIIEARRARHAFVAECAAEVLALQPRIVGFTTMFDQTCASVAVAKAIKAGPNPPLVVFGGANCEGEMGRQLLASIEWIDNVCTGEGDEVFPAYVDSVVRSGARPAIVGMPGREAPSPPSDPELIRDLDALPFPNYQDYVDRIRGSPVRDDLKIRLPFQSSRGCWWGAKQHCTFCGLNGQGMAYRSKSSDSVVRELSTLFETYGIAKFSSVDNILDMRHIGEVFPRLRDGGPALDLFYEVKANLRFEQLALLKAGGVAAIQPGLESLSNDVLRLMKKGCTALHNIQLLRWCKELGIEVAWNLLGGFPDEPIEAYRAMAALTPLLTHLTPPGSCTEIRLDRFSPLFTGAERMGLKRVRPKPAYYYIFPFGRLELQRLAYFFDFDYADGRRPETYMAPLRDAVNAWWRAASLPESSRPRLDASWLGPDEVVVTDTREGAASPTRRLTGVAARVLAACDTSRGLAGLMRDVGGNEEAVLSCLREMIDLRLVIEMEGRFLTLAVMDGRSAMTGDHTRDDAIRADPALPAHALLHPL